MIARYNLRQALLACLSLVVSLTAFALAWLFFNFAAQFALKWAGGAALHVRPTLIASVCVVLIGMVGFLRWRRGSGHYGFEESGMLITAAPRSAISMDVHETATRISAWGFILGQVFLAGPLRLLRALEHWRMRIPNSAQLENDLASLREQLRARNRWVPITEFPGRELHIAYLVRLGFVDWSPRKGMLRGK